MELQPVALYHGALGSKFGIPRQSGLVPSLKGYLLAGKQPRPGVFIQFHGAKLARKRLR